MRILLDTHAFLWFVWNNPRLSPVAKAAISDPNNDPLVSLVSSWEIAIKSSIGKLKLSVPFDLFITSEMQQNRLQRLDIVFEHLVVVAGLPFPPNHKDPFDRLLVAQAMVEQIPIVSNDPALDQYPITRMW